MICGFDWSSEIPYYSERKAIMLTKCDGLKIDNLTNVISKSGGMSHVGIFAIINNDKDCQKLKPFFVNNGYTNSLKVGNNEYLLKTKTD